MSFNHVQDSKINIIKSITKYIPFTLKALAIIILLPIVVLHTMEYFQPKKIFIDDIEVVAPHGTRLYAASVDHEDIQHPYSSFLFQNTYQYTFPELSMAMFWFHAISDNADARALHLYINAEKGDEVEDNFRKYIELHEKNKEYEKYKKIESNECFGYSEETKENINTSHVFHRKKNITISISSDNNYEVQKVLQQFCTDITK